MANVLVADIGGTKIAVALADIKGEIIHRVQVKSVPHDSEAMFEAVLGAFSKVMELGKIEEKEIQFMGIGVPGLVDSINGIAIYQNNLPWRDFPLVSRLKKTYPNVKLVMDNDVYMAAFGEWKARKLTNETFAYVTVSTGVSSCIMSGGHFIRGAGMAGELGFTAFVEGGEIKTLENLASGPAIVERAVRRFNAPSLKTKNVMELYYSKDPQAAEIIQETAKYIAGGLHQLFCVLDPHVVVLGGGVINYHSIFLDLIKKELKPFIQNPIQKDITKRIHLSYYKDDAGLQGARFRAVELV